MFNRLRKTLVAILFALLSTSIAIPANAQSWVAVQSSYSSGRYINIEIEADGSNLCATLGKNGGGRFTDDGVLYLRFRQLNTWTGNQNNYDYKFDLSHTGTLEGSYGRKICKSIRGKFDRWHDIYVRYGLYSDNDSSKEKSTGFASFYVY